MADYLAQQIIYGNLAYDYVISKKPNLKAGIDAYLISQGRPDLITS